jgi:competence protein ComEC
LSFRRSFAAGIAVTCGFSAWWLGSLQASGTSIAFLSVGQGDCSVVTSRGQTILIDAGPATPFSDTGKSIIMPWLKEHGVDSLAGVFLSHSDGDHVGGTPSILSAYPEARVVMSDQFRDDPAMLAHLQQWHMATDAVLWLPQQSTFELGVLHGFVDCPFRPPGSDTNNGSMFVRVWDGAGSATFTGDAPKSVEKEEETELDWRSEILHIGHHGSRTASDISWLQAVQPRFAIISVGRTNRYGLPNRQVLDELSSLKIPTLRTDLDGTLTFVFNGSEFVRQ